MKVTIYSAKGGQGKTPLALNMALHNEWGLLTNERTPQLEQYLNLDDQLIIVKPDEAFPNLPDGIGAVFDLGGMMDNAVQSVQSAITQSDVIVVPIVSDTSSRIGGVTTIHEILPHNQNIVVIANKLRRRGEDRRYETSDDYLHILGAMEAAGVGHVPVFPLKESAIFEDIFRHRCCIRDLIDGVDEDDERLLLPMVAHQHKEVVQQFETIMSYLKENYGQ